MKKSLKTRLTLNRETLRNLAADEMSGAQGGGVVLVSQGAGTCPVLITAVCVTQTCPTRCGQTYCYYV
ncbi:MAG TPA: class I lanthipeptide [Thermoanaerobaculia bacterium]|jgi:hypothetical protein|nr:class I lanthipeptide [Thermoanaerobaculia bacterium]